MRENYSAPKYAKGMRQFLPAQLEALATSLEQYVDSLTVSILARTRQPHRPSNSELPGRISRRFERCKAFGRDLDRPLKAYDGGQYGLYGTAAALELLAQSREAAQFEVGRKINLTPDSREWVSN